MSSRLPVEQMSVSPEYFDVLDIDVVTGRGFTQAERTADAGVVVVSETIARRLWPKCAGAWLACSKSAPAFILS